MSSNDTATLKAGLGIKETLNYERPSTDFDLDCKSAYSEMRMRENKLFCIANNRKQDINKMKGDAISMLSNFRNLFIVDGKALGEYVEARSIDHAYNFLVE